MTVAFKHFNNQNKIDAFIKALIALELINTTKAQRLSAILHQNIRNNPKSKELIADISQTLTAIQKELLNKLDTRQNTISKEEFKDIQTQRDRVQKKKNQLKKIQSIATPTTLIGVSILFTAASLGLSISIILFLQVAPLMIFISLILAVEIMALSWSVAFNSLDYVNRFISFVFDSIAEDYTAQIENLTSELNQYDSFRANLSIEQCEQVLQDIKLQLDEFQYDLIDVEEEEEELNRLLYSSSPGQHGLFRPISHPLENSENSTPVNTKNI